MYSDRGARDFVAEDIEGFCDIGHVVAWDGSLGSCGLSVGCSGRGLLRLLLLGLLIPSVDGLRFAIVLVLSVVVSTEGE